METLVKLKFGDGNFQQGFNQKRNKITITNPEGKSTEIEIQLPSAPEIPVLYQKWLYRYGLLTNPLRISFKRKQVTNFSWPECYRECEQFAQDLLTHLNDWLLDIKPQLEELIKVNPDSEIIFVIDTQDIKSQSTKDILHRLPWREWDHLYESYCLETALCLNESQIHVKEVENKEIFRRVKVTSIFGARQNIDIQIDRKLIEKLQQRGAELTFLSQPQRPDFIELWDEPCDILFYSGHSQTDKTNQVGYLQINQEESLNPEEIKNTFREAIAKGLKLAIFNSCDGLGLAQQFANLGLPYIIVWREAVPDKIAQDFLKYFLHSFSKGKSLFSSVRDARIKIQELTTIQDIQKQPPGVNWLPVICKNTLDPAPKWDDLGGLTGKLPDSPYKGLSAFQEKDADFFFGRKKFIADLVQAVNTKAFVPVVGASGSGKSSLVFAGLVPRLREASMQIVSFRPGNNPFDALAVALSAHHQSWEKQTQIASPPVLTDTLPLEKEGLGSRLKELELEINLQHDEKELCKIIESFVNFGKSSQRFVLIADQFEELYTLAREEQRQPFLDALLYALKFAPAFTLVLTLRADFYGHALAYRPFSDALQAGIYNLAPMNPEELRAAIEKPAHKMKVELEQGLTTKLIDDLGKKPGRLPLLQFTLSLLWQKPNKWYLTHQAYGEIGGLEKALTKYADSVLNSLSVTEKERAERIFIQLMRPGEGTEDTKRVATRAEVEENNWNLVKCLADNRLVVTGWDEVNRVETVEIIHEALIREWETLRKWIRRNREFRIWQERLKPDVREWENKKYDPEILLQGTRLAIAQDWYKQRANELTILEQDFINASIKRRDKEQRKQKRTRQLTISALVRALMLVSIFAVISEIRRVNAEVGRISSVAEKLFAQNNHEAALTTAIKGGKLLNQSIWKPYIEIQTRKHILSILREIVYGYQVKTLELKGHSRPIDKISFSPDGKIIASSSDDGKIKLWNITKSKEIRTISGGHPGNLLSLNFSPDGKTITAISYDGMSKVFDTTTGKEIETSYFKPKWDSGRVTSASLSPDGNIIAYGFRDTVKLLDINTGKEIGILTGHSRLVTSVSFSPDGQNITSASVDGVLKLWDVPTAREIKSLNIDSGWVNSVTISPDGKFIASTLPDGIVKLLDINRNKIEIFKGDSKFFHSLIFCPKGKIIAFVSDDGTLKLWDRDTAQVKLWDPKTGKNIGTISLKGHSASLISTSIRLSPDGKAIIPANIESLLSQGCNLIRDYLQNNPGVSKDDKHLCDDIAS